jgi:hypothetical protein
MRRRARSAKSPSVNACNRQAIRRNRRPVFAHLFPPLSTRSSLPTLGRSSSGDEESPRKGDYQDVDDVKSERGLARP